MIARQSVDSRPAFQAGRVFLVVINFIFSAVPRTDSTGNLTASNLVAGLEGRPTIPGTRNLRIPTAVVPWYAAGMRSPFTAVKDRFLKFAGELRFPRLLALTVFLFAIDLVIPDVIPLADEILLGLVAAILGTLKKKRRDQIAATAAPPAANLPPPK